MNLNSYGIDCTGWELQPNFKPYGDRALDMLGYLPAFISDLDQRPAAEQFQARYAFGGWRPMQGGEWTVDADHILRYPDDPLYYPVAAYQLRDELICVYQYSFVAIFQKDGSFEVARLD